MKTNSTFRALIITFAFLCVSIAICIANVIKLNIIALCLDMVLIMSICFVLGYYFCRYEDTEKDKSIEISNFVEEETEEKDNEPVNTTIVLDGKEL